jgi:hypothetical protein
MLMYSSEKRNKWSSWNERTCKLPSIYRDLHYSNGSVATKNSNLLSVFLEEGYRLSGRKGVLLMSVDLVQRRARYKNCVSL